MSGTNAILKPQQCVWKKEDIIDFVSRVRKTFDYTKARETSLNYYHFLKKYKKKTLIHCIVHDLTGQLTGINYCFELLAFKIWHPKEENIWKRVRSNLKGDANQDVLNAFAAEVESQTFILDPAQAPDVLTCAKGRRCCANLFTEQYKLTIKPDMIYRGLEGRRRKLRLEGCL